MFNRTLLAFAALALFAASPAFASGGAHASRGASQQGLEKDANFAPSTTVENGITVTQFLDDTSGTLVTYEIFGMPADYSTGTSYVLTFSNLSLGYGVFDCNNPTDPSLGFAVSADTPGIDLKGPCTAEAAGASDPFTTYNESGNTSTVKFSGSSGPAFYFWTIDENLLSITPAGTTGTTPEPGTYAMLAAGLLAITLLRRRAANNVA